MGAVAYDAVVIRLVPRVHVPSGEAIGVALHARRASYIGLQWTASAHDLALRWDLDGALLARYLTALARVCEGGAEAGPIGCLPPSERFHWLAATRSTVLQPGPVHTGLSPDPAQTLDAIAERIRRPPSEAG